MPILAWFFGGSFLANIAIGAFAIFLSSGAAYIKGRSDCANAAEVASLHAQVKSLNRQIEIRDWLDEVSGQQAMQEALANQHNVKVDEGVKDVIDKAPLISDCAPASFFDRLRNYQ